MQPRMHICTVAPSARCCVLSPVHTWLACVAAGPPVAGTHVRMVRIPSRAHKRPPTWRRRKSEVDAGPVKLSARLPGVEATHVSL